MADTDSKQTKLRKWSIYGTLLILFLFLLTGLYWYLYTEAEPPTVQWKSTTVPYEQGCDPECRPIQSISSSHGSNALLMYNPEIDDPVAQWGDGLSSVMSCLEGTDPGNSQALPSCVKKSPFPDQCKNRFSDRVNQSAGMRKQLKTFEEIFVKKGGYCVPE